MVQTLSNQFASRSQQDSLDHILLSSAGGGQQGQVLGLPWWSSGLHFLCRGLGSHPWSGKFHMLHSAARKKKKKQVHPHPCLLDFFTWMLTEHLRPNKGKAGPTYARCPSILTISAIPFFYMLRSKTSKSSIMPLLLSYPTSNFSAKTCLPIYNMYSKSSHFLQPLQFTTLVPATASLPISLLSPWFICLPSAGQLGWCCKNPPVGSQLQK